MQTAKDTSQVEITVFYDGLCQLCSREIDHYRKMRGSHRISFVDITAAGFDAQVEGLDPYKVHQSLHVRDVNGQIYVGVDSFLQIWSRLDSMKKVVPLASWGPVKKVLQAGYFCFAKVRPLLPKRDCSDSPYCELKPNHNGKKS